MDLPLTSVHVEQVPANAVLMPAAVTALPKTGRGRAIGHHGEILQGVFDDAEGRPVRALVTLSVRRLTSLATFRPDRTGALQVQPAWKIKARRAAELTLGRLGVPISGLLTIDNAIVPRWGLGSSTTDVVAATRAVAAAFRSRLAPDAVAAIAVQAETACDSTMYGERAVLFAQRRGVLLEDLGPSLPPMHVIGFNLDPTGWGVDTLSFPPARYTCWEIEAFRPLRGLLRRAIRTQDAALLGQVASASARINQRYLAKPHFDELERIAERCGAVGVQVAHSGSVTGILLRRVDGTAECAAAVHAALAELGIAPTWTFDVGGSHGLV